VSGKTIYRRVGVFHSQEVHVEANPGEWVRDDSLSTKPLSDNINDWCVEHGVEPVHCSPPATELVSTGRTPDQLPCRVYRVSVSVIYVPAEIIDYGQEEKTVRDINPAGLPSELQHIIQTINESPRAG